MYKVDLNFVTVQRVRWDRPHDLVHQSPLADHFPRFCNFSSMTSHLLHSMTSKFPLMTSFSPFVFECYASLSVGSCALQIWSECLEFKWLLKIFFIDEDLSGAWKFINLATWPSQLAVERCRKNRNFRPKILTLPLEDRFRKNGSWKIKF